MRVALACSLLVLAACGGSQKPAATESADTSSLESPSTGSAGSSDTSSSSSSTSTSTSTDKPAPAASSAPAATAAPPAANHPVPGATGSIDGKPFTPKLAQVAGPLQKDGRLLIVLHEGSDCVTSADAKPGTASMMLMVPWKDGYKVDLASLKRAKKNSMGEATFIRIGDDKKNQIAADFKPTGLVTIVSAPMQQDAIGKMKIDLQSGDYMLAGDLDVKVCFPPK
ncbi:MAG TPA: hypothetical protein VIF15_05500 [Polyangiaceae bacterium]|jgi:hypothetical protein